MGSCSQGSMMTMPALGGCSAVVAVLHAHMMTSQVHAMPSHIPSHMHLPSGSPVVEEYLLILLLMKHTTGSRPCRSARTHTPALCIPPLVSVEDHVVIKATASEF